MLAALIVEDEKPAARLLKRMCESLSVQVVGMAHGVQEAINWLQRNPPPELIFLDIELGDGTGFDLLEQAQPSAAIIFTTAYDQFVLKAFKHNSVDYLLKPIQKEELKFALQKFQKQREEKANNLEQVRALMEYMGKTSEPRWLVKVGTQLKPIALADIVCFYASEGNTYLCTADREYPVDEPLHQLEFKAGSRFFAINRSALVNKNFIETIHIITGSRLKLMLAGNRSFFVSRERVEKFKLWMQS